MAFTVNAGRDLERHYRERAGAFFGRWLRPVSLVLSDTLRETLEARLPDIMRLQGVAGERLTLGALEASQEAPLIVLQDGRSTGWDEALAAA